MGDDRRVLRIVQLIAPDKFVPEPWELRSVKHQVDLGIHKIEEPHVLRCPVAWAVVKRKRVRGSVYVGICSYSTKACMIGTETHAMIVRDLLVDTQKQECEEARRCLHLSCSLNCTTKETYANSKKGEDARKFANRYFDKMVKAIESFPAEDALKPAGLLEPQPDTRVSR